MICNPKGFWQLHRASGTDLAKAGSGAENLLMIAEKKFRRLNSPELLEQVYNGQRFEDGTPVQEVTPKRHAD
ncbi:MAG TPA: hypothetical protein VJX23_11710 [Candidatus Binataceae bacterium]|nr:hypothetical protein [Candidatus Binataceae bacterium]